MLEPIEQLLNGEVLADGDHPLVDLYRELHFSASPNEIVPQMNSRLTPKRQAKTRFIAFAERLS